jgi:hypothetical protein
MSWDSKSKPARLRLPLIDRPNVQSYTGRFDEASWHFLAHLGPAPSYFREAQRALVALDQRTQCKLEVLSGSLLNIRTELVELMHAEQAQSYCQAGTYGLAAEEMVR